MRTSLLTPIFLAIYAFLSVIPARVYGSSCDSTPALPIPPSDAITYTGHPSSDEFSEIQRAIGQLRAGDWLTFPARSYMISKHLTVPTSGVTIYGKGATILATNPSDGAILIQGDDVSIYGFTLNQKSTSRLGTPWSGGISVFDDRKGVRRSVQRPVIQGNTVNNSAATGIFLYKANSFLVIDNTVFRSWADGIHVTGGSTNGRILNNTVSQTGDDMIAVVSYAGNTRVGSISQRYQNRPAMGSALSKNILIQNNRLSDQYWGRGIAVAGGSDITIEHNSITKTPTAAAIYLTRETSYQTFGDHNILVRNNSISRVQSDRASFNPKLDGSVQTRHGAIEIGSEMLDDENHDAQLREEFSISTISIIGNSLEAVKFAGIRIGANSQPNSIYGVTVTDNVLQNIGSSGVAEIHAGMDQSTLSCKQNKLNGANWPNQCDKSVPPISESVLATGASLTCDQGESTIEKPKPPSTIEAR